MTRTLRRSEKPYSQPSTPSDRVFFRHSSANFFEIHPGFLQKFAFDRPKIPRLSGIFAYEYSFLKAAEGAGLYACKPCFDRRAAGRA